MEWRGAHWEVRDLGSRNGTVVAGHRLAAGEIAILCSPSVIQFGDEAESWEIESDSPPPARASTVDDGEPASVVGDTLLLPSEDTPLATVHRETGGAWRLDDGRGCRAVTDGAEIVVGDRRWRLSLPVLLPPTHDATGGPVDRVHFRFQRRQASGEIELTLVQAGRTERIERHGFLQLLLHLASRRLEDRGRGVPLEAEGWTHIVDVESALRCASTTINVWVFRARGHLATHGITLPDDIVERRLGSGEIRLGSADVEVTGPDR